MRITQIVNVHGESFNDSWVENTVIVTNLCSDSLDIGIRYFWDLSIAGDDGPIFLQRSSGTEFGENEMSLTELDFSFFVANANEFINTDPPAYNVFGSVDTPEHLLQTPQKPIQPNRLQFVSWPFAFFKAFTYLVNDSLNVARDSDPTMPFTGGDSAIQIYWGDTRETCLTIPPWDSVQVTQALVAGPINRDPRILDPQSKFLFGVDSDDDRLVQVDVEMTNPTVEILGKVVDGSKPLQDMEAMTWDPVSRRILVISDEDDDGPLYMIDPADINGTANIPATFVGNTDSDEIEGIAVHPVTGELFGVDNSSHKLVKISLSDGTVTEIGKLGFKDVGGLAFTLEPNPVLYGADSKIEKLITIDTETGAGTPVNPANTIGFPDVECLEFAQDGTLFGFSNGNTHKFITIDITTGIGNEFPTLGSGSLDIEGFTFMLPDELLTGSTVTTIKNKPSSVPDDFLLEQNYPNPFNPTTNLGFQIHDTVMNEVYVQLKIYNLLGELVRVLVDERKSPGQYQAEWDGRDEKGNLVSSGIYLYQLTADDFRQTRRMLVLK